MHIMTLYTQIDMYEYIYYARVLNSVLCCQYTSTCTCIYRCVLYMDIYMYMYMYILYMQVLDECSCSDRQTRCPADVYIHVSTCTRIYRCVLYSCVYIHIHNMYIICMQVHDGMAYRYNMYTWHVLCSCMHTHDSTFALQVLAPGQ